MAQSVKQCRSYRLALGMAACALFWVMTGSPAGLAQQAAATATATPATGTTASAHVGAARAAKPNVQAEDEETAKPGKPGSEGIKVHGHWVIDVRNPDGALVRHKDFENSLVTQGQFVSGDQLLAGLLSGTVTPSDPAVMFVASGGSPGADPSTYCQGTQIYLGYCSLLTTGQSLAASDVNTQTGLTAMVNFSPTVSWVLSGNWTVSPGLTGIVYVQTLLPTCAANSFGTSNLSSNASGQKLSGSAHDGSADAPPNACVNGVYGTSVLPNDYRINFPLTSTLIPNEPAGGMPVTPGQIITVTVTISFS